MWFHSFMKTEDFQISEHFCFHDKAVYDKLSYINNGLILTIFVNMDLV